LNALRVTTSSSTTSTVNPRSGRAGVMRFPHWRTSLSYNMGNEVVRPSSGQPNVSLVRVNQPGRYFRLSRIPQRRPRIRNLRSRPASSYADSCAIGFCPVSINSFAIIG
jgi:hypothetical protein